MKTTLLAPNQIEESNSDPAHDVWSSYSLFGLVMATDFPFTSHLAPSTKQADFVFTHTLTPPVSVKWEQTTPLYTSSVDTFNNIAARFYHFDSYDVLQIIPLADFYLWPEQIICHCLSPTVPNWILEIYLLGSLLSLWFEIQGVPTLHATAVCTDTGAIAFLSGNGAGKSVLAATMMQANCPLLTDDLLPIRHQNGTFSSPPGYPQMRLWPKEAQHFLGHQDLAPVHPETPKRRILVGYGGFGAFCETPLPLSCIYLPEKCDPLKTGAEAEIVPVPPRDAVIELVRHSFTPHVVEGIGLQPRRLAFFAQMSQQIPVRRLRYPSGLEYLPQVKEAILQDIENLRVLAKTPPHAIPRR